MTLSSTKAGRFTVKGTIRAIVAGAMLLLSSGCSMSVDTAVVALDARLGSPILGLNDEIPVFIPGRRRENRQPLRYTAPVTRDNYQGLYPEYIFNQ